MNVISTTTVALDLTCCEIEHTDVEVEVPANAVTRVDVTLPCCGQTTEVEVDTEA